MENNNFQKDVNNVNENVKQEPNNQKGKTIALLIIVLVLTLIIGIGGGYLLSKNGNLFNKNETQSNQPANTNNGSKEKNEVIKVVSSENNSKQMIVEGKDKNNNTVWTYTTPAENVPEQLVNEGLKLIETRKGKVYLCDWGKLYILDEQTGDVLAKNTEKNIGAAKVYAFDENDYLYTVSYLSFLNKFDTDAKLIKSTEEVWNKGFAWPQNMTLSGNNLIIDYGEEGAVTVNKDSFKIVDETENKTNAYSYFEQNKNLNYTSNPKDNINGKVAIIKMGEKTFQTTKHDGYYTYTDNFGNSYNIKEITNITSEYRMTSTDGATNLFRAVIEYVDNNNAKKSFDTAVFVPNDANNYTTLSIYGPYENYTGTTSFVRAFTDLYDDGSKLPNGTSKIIKQLSPSGWAGSSMQEIRLYDNGDAYHIVYNGDGNTDENISSFKLIARNVDTIEEKMNGQEFESIIVKGKYLTKVTDDDQLWILFENN